MVVKATAERCFSPRFLPPLLKGFSRFSSPPPSRPFAAPATLPSPSKTRRFESFLTRFVATASGFSRVRPRGSLSSSSSAAVGLGPRRRDDDVTSPDDRRVMAGRDLLLWRDMPRHLQFNPYIHTGYRPLLTFWGSLASLFYLHNETINIVSHGLPILFILLVSPRVMPWSQIDSHFLAWCHIAGSISPWIGSFIYHLFMNMNLPPAFYHRLLQLDMLGIWVSQSFGALPMVCASVFCLPRILQWLLISCYCIFAIYGLFKALTASSPWNRRLCFALPFCMRNLLCVLRLTRFGGGDPLNMTNVILQDLLSVIGGAIGACNFPEKWLPGCLDYYCNSHNIMHVLVVMAVYYMYHSARSDLIWMAQGSCDRFPKDDALSFKDDL